MKRTVISSTIPYALRERLRERAAHQGVTPSELIARMIEGALSESQTEQTKETKRQPQKPKRQPQKPKKDKVPPGE